MAGGKLTDKQSAFVREYLIDKNGTQAAIRAGYSKKTAGQIAEENLKKPEIKAAVQKGMEKHAERCAVTIESLTDELNEAATMAREQDDSNALRQAVMAKAKIHGLDVNKTEVTGAEGKDLNFTVNVLAKPNGN